MNNKVLISILTYLLLSCNSRTDKHQQTESPILERQEKENVDTILQTKKTTQSDNNDNVKYDNHTSDKLVFKILSQLIMASGEKYTDYYDFDDDPESRPRIISSFTNSLNDSISLVGISFFYDLCWHPIDVFVINSDTNLISNFTVDCEKCGCETNSYFNTAQENDSTFIISEEMEEIGADTSIFEIMEYSIKINKNGNLDTLWIKKNDFESIE